MLHPYSERIHWLSYGVGGILDGKLIWAIYRLDCSTYGSILVAVRCIEKSMRRVAVRRIVGPNITSQSWAVLHIAHCYFISSFKLFCYFIWLDKFGGICTLKVKYFLTFLAKLQIVPKHLSCPTWFFRKLTKHTEEVPECGNIFLQLICSKELPFLQTNKPIIPTKEAYNCVSFVFQ